MEIVPNDHEWVEKEKIIGLSYSSSISATTLDVRLMPVASWVNKTDLFLPRRNSAVMLATEDSKAGKAGSDLGDDSLGTEPDSSE